MHAWQRLPRILPCTVPEHWWQILNSKYCNPVQYESLCILSRRLLLHSVRAVRVELSAYVHDALHKKGGGRENQLTPGPLATLHASAKVNVSGAVAKVLYSANNRALPLPASALICIHCLPTFSLYLSRAHLPPVFLGTAFVSADEWTALAILQQQPAGELQYYLAACTCPGRVADSGQERDTDGHSVSESRDDQVYKTDNICHINEWDYLGKWYYRQACLWTVYEGPDHS